LTYSADLFTFTIGKRRIAEAKSQGVKDFLRDCLLLSTFTILEKERYGNHDFRSALQKEIRALCSELVSRCVVATDYLALPSHLMGSPFAHPNGEGFKEYITLLFSRKDAFTRAPYFETIKANLS
jgi:hypothetical protein